MDAVGWDQRYDTSEFVWATEPNRFLPPEVEGLTPGRALDVACGEGRNAVWLATQGWDATGIDFSSVGLAKAAQLAEHAGVTCDWVVADTTEPFPESLGAFDLVIVDEASQSDLWALPAVLRGKQILAGLSAER